MYLEGEIESELRKTNLSRNRFAYLAQFFIIIGSIWYQTEFQGPNWPFTVTLATIGCLFRFLATEVVKNKKELSNRFMWAGFLILGVAWSFHFHVNFDRGYPSEQSLVYLWFTVAGTAFVCYLTLVADPWSYVCFVTPISLTMITRYAMKGFGENLLVVFNLLILLVLTSVSFRHQHRQLRELIRSRILSQRERQRLRILIDSIPGFVGILDEKGVYVDGNQQILSIFPNLIGTKIGELAGDNEFSRFVVNFMASGKSRAIGETSAVLKGESVHMMTSCGKIEDGYMLINIPITELVNARKDLREREAVAQYSSKLASIGQMAAGVAHEVNNPLAIIQGSANIISDLVQEEEIDRPNLILFSEKIVSTTDRIAQIVRSLRSLSRGGEKDPFSPLSIKSLLRSVQDISTHNFRSYEINLIIPDNAKDITVLGREVQLGQVLLNLLSNAFDAVKNLPERWVKIDYGHLDGYVWIEVVDSGNGIPAEHISKLWDPFFTTKVKDEGTGLGLSISVKIIEEHGGKITYEENRPNTTFRVTFPTPKI